MVSFPLFLWSLCSFLSSKLHNLQNKRNHITGSLSTAANNTHEISWETNEKNQNDKLLYYDKQKVIEESPHQYKKERKVGGLVLFNATSNWGNYSSQM